MRFRSTFRLPPLDFSTDEAPKENRAGALPSTSDYGQHDEEGAGSSVSTASLQRRDGQWVRAKGFDTFCPLGPAIATGVRADRLAIRSRLNGEVKQESNTAQLIFDVPCLLSFISGVMTLLPGDVILTGTPAGVGPMRAGDEIEVEIEGLGVLANSVTSAER